jgi:hypothetical protein
MMSIVVGTNSWVTEAEADAYLATRFGAGDYWVSGVDKEAAIATAYSWLINSPKFSLTADTDAAQKIKDAQCEMALFLVMNQPDIDIRLGLQSQGVMEAGIVKEKYNGKKPTLPIPFTVAFMLEDYAQERAIHMINLERNEDEGVDYNAYNNREDDES